MSLTHKNTPCRAARLMVLVVVAVGATVIPSGCGKSRVDRVRVHGKVTFNGAVPPADGMLIFSPIEPAEGYPARPARAKLSRGDGTFTVTSVRPDDGLVPGTYSVEIICWRRPPTEETPGISYVPASYSPPELNVALDGPNPIEIEYNVPAMDVNQR